MGKKKRLLKKLKLSVYTSKKGPHCYTIPALLGKIDNTANSRLWPSRRGFPPQAVESGSRSLQGDGKYRSPGNCQPSPGTQHKSRFRNVAQDLRANRGARRGLPPEHFVGTSRRRSDSNQGRNVDPGRAVDALAASPHGLQGCLQSSRARNRTLTIRCGEGRARRGNW